MTNVIDLEAFREARQHPGQKRVPGPYAPNVGDSAPHVVDAGDDRQDTPPDHGSDRRSQVRKRAASREEIAAAARACRAGLTAHMEVICASLRRSIAYAAELEDWADTERGALPRSVARYWKLERTFRGGVCSCEDRNRCAFCKASRTLDRDFWGLFQNQIAVCELMSIAAGGVAEGEAPRDALSSIEDGVDIPSLAEAIAEAVETSLATGVGGRHA